MKRVLIGISLVAILGLTGCGETVEKVAMSDTSMIESTTVLNVEVEPMEVELETSITSILEESKVTELPVQEEAQQEVLDNAVTESQQEVPDSEAQQEITANGGTEYQENQAVSETEESRIEVDNNMFESIKQDVQKELHTVMSIYSIGMSGESTVPNEYNITREKYSIEKTIKGFSTLDSFISDIESKYGSALANSLKNNVDEVEKTSDSIKIVCCDSWIELAVLDVNDITFTEVTEDSCTVKVYVSQSSSTGRATLTFKKVNDVWQLSNELFSDVEWLEGTHRDFCEPVDDFKARMGEDFYNEMMENEEAARIYEEIDAHNGWLR